MTRVILAHIRAIRTGHSARARIEAVDAQGLDYKLEVPTDEVRGAVGDMLVLSWTIHSNPAAATTPIAAATTTATAPASSPTSATDVDEQFDDLMRGAAARSAPTPEQQFVSLLGATAAREIAGASVDDAFMTLMARGRSTSGTSVPGVPFTTPVGPSKAPDHGINDEFNTLLGSARTKG